jgi:Conjugative transposon protein TcpC
MFPGPESGNGKHSTDYYHAFQPSRPLLGWAGPGPGTLDDDIVSRDPGPPPGEAWAGSGGRWRLWPLRILLWTALLVVAYRGVTAIVFGQAGAARAGGSSAGGAAGAGFPVTLAEAYATEFGQVYLNFSPDSQAQREQELAAFVPSGVAAADPDLGWNGTGQLSLQSEQVAGIAVQDPRHAVVTLLATVNGQLMELGVPVIASGGGVAIAGEPAWLGAPQPISPPLATSQGSDPVARAELLAELPAFFQAYAEGGSALGRFLARGASVTGLDGAVAFDSIAVLSVPPGGATRQISVTVIWQLPGPGSQDIAEVAARYRMSLTHLQSGKWYVNEISASTEAVGAK